MNESEGRRQPAPADGLCPRCEHVRLVRSSRGSVFYRCSLAATNPRFPKYPMQPVVVCGGYAATTASHEAGIDP
jgi:hypothetical protein